MYHSLVTTAASLPTSVQREGPQGIGCYAKYAGCHEIVHVAVVNGFADDPGFRLRF